MENRQQPRAQPESVAPPPAARRGIKPRRPERRKSMAELEILMKSGDVFFARPTLLSYSGDNAITEVDRFCFAKMNDDGIIMERSYITPQTDVKSLNASKENKKVVILTAEQVKEVEHIALGGAILWQNDGSGKLVRPNDIPEEDAAEGDDLMTLDDEALDDWE